MTPRQGTSVQSAMTLLPSPRQNDVDELRELLDLLERFSDNDQRARFLLSSNWLRDYTAAK
jgi:hypothetical protein